MTEICTGYPGKESTKAVGPRDSYHEPYPGYWNKKPDQAPEKASSTGVPQQTVGTPRS